MTVLRIAVLLGVVLNLSIRDNNNVWLTEPKYIGTVSTLASMVGSDENARCRKVPLEIAAEQQIFPARLLHIARNDNSEVAIGYEGDQAKIVRVCENRIRVPVLG